MKEAKGWIDPCPFRDADGSLWLVHAWAKSRAGFNGILTVHRLSPDGLSVVDEGVNVFDGGTRHPTIEGPKLYRRGEWVYIFAPAGGVKTGWQTVLRSRSVLGPYEERIVLAQGPTEVNGPHQGALVDTPSGESWFVHFQDRGPYGRITHLQPVTWRDGWPVIGEDPDGDGTGQPVLVHALPGRRPRRAPGYVRRLSDEFDGPSLSADVGLEREPVARVALARGEARRAPPLPDREDGRSARLGRPPAERPPDAARRRAARRDRPRRPAREDAGGRERSRRPRARRCVRRRREDARGVGGRLRLRAATSSATGSSASSSAAPSAPAASSSASPSSRGPGSASRRARTASLSRRSATRSSRARGRGSGRGSPSSPLRSSARPRPTSPTSSGSGWRRR